MNDNQKWIKYAEAAAESDAEVKAAIARDDFIEPSVLKRSSEAHKAVAEAALDWSLNISPMSGFK